MSIFPRPLKQVLGKIIPFSQEDKIPTFNLGSGTADNTTYLRGDGTWSSVTGSASNKMYTVGINSTGSTLYKGTIVYISGSTGNRPNFVKAQANSEATSAGTFGVIEADIPNNSDGNCVTIGTIDNLDTRTVATHPFTDVTLSDGDTIYLHPTIAGYITNIKPSAPNHLVYVGKVVRTHPTLGTIVYRIQNGYEIDELHDVAISSPTNGQILQYESATSLWKNVTPSSGGLTVGTTSITSGTAGRVLFEDATNKLNESANFYWDNTNSRLSIGQGSSPGARLDIRTAGTATTDYGIRIRNSSNTFDDFTVNGRGKVSISFNSSTDGFFLAPQDAEFSQVAYGGLKIQSFTNTEGYIGHGVGAYKFGIGANTPQARLDIRSQGALSTDMALRVRNSANNDNILLVKGNQSIDFLGAGTGGYLNLSRSGGNVTLKHRATAVLPSQFIISSYGDGGSIGQIVFDTVFGTNAAPTFTMQKFISGLSDLTGSSLYTPFGSNAAVFVMKNALNYAGYGIIPTGTATDHFAMYSADIVAGNAAPHFRTEAGDIIKLYKETTAIAASTFVSNTSLIANDTATFDGYTIGQVVKALRNIGILA